MGTLGGLEQITQLKSILCDENQLWGDFICDVNLILQGESRLTPATQLIEFCCDTESSFRAARTLRRLGYRIWVDDHLRIRILKACDYAQWLQDCRDSLSVSDLKSVRLAILRDTSIASLLLRLGCEKFLNRNVRKKLIIALEDIANDRNVPRALRTIRERYEVEKGMQPAPRLRKRNVVALCDKLNEYSHAILCEDGLKLLTYDSQETLVSLKTRYMRLLTAAWIASLKNWEIPFPNTPQPLMVTSRSLRALIGTGASRTNISQLRKAIVFDKRIEFLYDEPSETAIPVKVGFKFLKDDSTIGPSDVSRIALEYRVEI